VKRIFDIIASAIALTVLSPLMLIAAVAIKLGSKGPVFFRAQRAGVGAVPFQMYKFRSMHVLQDSGASKITAARDPRIFTVGKILRATKIDELPQLFNVLIGDMSVVGPRPEDMSIVSDHYEEWMMETLRLRPGMASPGSIYGSIYDYRREANPVKIDDTENDYLRNLLPLKLAIELVYVRKQSFSYDVNIVFRTLAMLFNVLLRKQLDDPPEFEEALQILEQARHE
jgi:lipopolysaccharide/colanic/teichoic acid biosynthesis glycosyltransferase